MAVLHTPLTDEELVHAVTVEGESDLYGILYDRYADRVYRKCISFSKDEVTAQDMVQEIFLKVFFKLPKFRQESKFSTWLYAITFNFCVEHYRKQNRVRFVDIEDVPETFDDSADEAALLAAQVEALKATLEKLDPADRALLLMKYQENMSIQEIMEAMEIKESAAKMRLARARKRARNIMEELHLEGMPLAKFMLMVSLLEIFAV